MSMRGTNLKATGPRLVAFAGYAGTGKDTAARPLLAAGFRRLCFGDVIKDLFDPLVRQHLGFSAHTGDRTEKAQIRELLVHGGEAFYAPVSRRFFAAVDDLIDQDRRVVNTRLCRPPEAREWRRRGGLIIELVRPGCGPAEPMEAQWLEELRSLGLIGATVVNDGDVETLHRQVLQAAGLQKANSEGREGAKAEGSGDRSNQ